MRAAPKKLEVLAIIPARGGSKSLPRKNVVPLLGKPLIAFSIEDARRSKLITRVIVSTDDEEIALIAKKHSAAVPFLRPAKIAGDASIDIEYLIHALEWLSAHEGYRPDLVVTLRPTEPLRRVRTIDKAIAALAARPEVDSLRSVRRATESAYKMWLIMPDGMMEPVASLPGVAEPYNQPRQMLPVVYWQDGYIDVAWTDTILKLRSSTGRKVLAFVTQEEGVNIDYAEELPQAERALSKRNRKAQRNRRPLERYPS